MGTVPSTEILKKTKQKEIVTGCHPQVIGSTALQTENDEVSEQLRDGTESLVAAGRGHPSKLLVGS